MMRRAPSTVASLRMVAETRRYIGLAYQHWARGERVTARAMLKHGRLALDLAAAARESAYGAALLMGARHE